MVNENVAAIYKKIINSYFDNNNYQESYRLGYHFSPPLGWMNDPNGLCYYNGEYHIYFQHIYPINDKEWSPMGWGHASTKDFKNYTIHPMAIYADESGMAWSGSCVYDEHNTSGFFKDGGGLVAAYTRTLPEIYWQKISIAHSSDGIVFTDYENNPVLPNTDFIQNFRDPKVFYHEPTKRWIMIIAGGTARFYESKDLKNWTFLSKNEDIFSECPDFFPLPVDGDKSNIKWVFMLGGRFHQQKKCAYCIGSFDGTKFTVEAGPFDLNHGADIYAPQSFANIYGKVLWIYWMDFWTNKDRPYQHQSVPYELSLKTIDGVGVRLVQTPSTLLHSLREDSIEAENINLDKPYAPDIVSNQYEMHAQLKCKAGSFKIELLKSANETVVLEYNRADNTLTLDRSQSGNMKILEDSPKVFTAPLLANRDDIDLTILVDRGSVEVFVNGGEDVITALVYPDEKDKTLLFSSSGDTVLKNLKLYKLSSIKVNKSKEFEEG